MKRKLSRAYLSRTPVPFLSTLKGSSFLPLTYPKASPSSFLALAVMLPPPPLPDVDLLPYCDATPIPAPFEILHADRLEHAISLPVLHFNVLHTQGLSVRPQAIELLVKQVDLVGILEFLEDCQLLGFPHGRFHSRRNWQSMLASSG